MCHHICTICERAPHRVTPKISLDRSARTSQKSVRGRGDFWFCSRVRVSVLRLSAMAVPFPGLLGCRGVTVPGMSADISAAITAVATCVLGAAAIGAFVFAALAWRDQRRLLAVQAGELSRQAEQLDIQNERLELARQGSRHLRTPVLHAVIDSVGQGVPNFRLDVRLISPEPLESLRVSVAEARAGDCPLGFTAGQDGVEQYPDEDALPPGWRMDVLRHEAAWHEPLAPGTAATWQMAYRRQLPGRGGGWGRITLRAEAVPAGGGEPWRVPVAVTLSDDADRELRELSGPGSGETVPEAT